MLPSAAYKKGWPWAKPADMGRQRSQLGLQAPKRKEAWLSVKATPNSRVAATPTRQKIMGRETQPSHTTILRAEVTSF